MKAQFIYEKFEEESDPITDMGIGIERPIDFKSKNELTRWVLKHLKYILHVKKIPKDIVQDDEHFIKYEYTILISTYARKYFTVKGANRFPSDCFPNWEKMREIFINKGYKEIDDSETYVNEKFTDETNPIHDMGIGIVGIREFDTVAEAAKTFVDNVNILTKGLIRSPKHFQVLFNKVAAGTGTVNEISPLVECKRYLDGFYFKIAPLLIHELGGRFDRVTQRIQFLKDFKNAVRDYVYVDLFKEINEKFIQDSDPIKDMGIGIIALKKVFIKQLNAFKKEVKHKYGPFELRGINDGIDILEGTIFETENKFSISKAIRLLNAEIKNWHDLVRYLDRAEHVPGVINGLSNVRSFAEGFKNQFNLK